jgi:hypothetical protein
MLRRSARRSRGRPRTPPHGCTSGQSSPLRRTHELRHLVAASVMLGRRLAKKRSGRACLPRRLRAGSSSAPYGAELHPPRPGVYRGALVRPHSEQSSERQGLRRGRAENRAAARILSASPHYANPPKRAERVSAVALATGLDDRRGSTYASIEGWVCFQPHERTNRANTSRSSGVAANCVCAESRSRTKCDSGARPRPCRASGVLIEPPLLG